LPAIPVSTPEPAGSPNSTQLAVSPTVPEPTANSAPGPMPTPNPTPMAARRWTPSPVVAASEKPRPRQGVSYLADDHERSRGTWDLSLPDPLGVRSPNLPASDAAHLSQSPPARFAFGARLAARWKRWFGKDESAESAPVAKPERVRIVPASELAATSRSAPFVPASPADPAPDAPLLNVQASGTPPAAARPETATATGNEPALAGGSQPVPETAPDRQTGWVSALAFPSRDPEARKTSQTSPLAPRPARVPIVTRVWRRLRGESVADDRADSIGTEAGNLPEGRKSVD
jgi:hypothetical protein